MIGLLLAGCTTPNPKEGAAPSHHEDLDTAFWRCDGGEQMQTRQGGQRLWLQLPGSDSWLELQAARAASGQRYENNQGTGFWTQGERARVFTPQKQWSFCRLETQAVADQGQRPDSLYASAASPDALTLRVLGHHPGWLLEVWQRGEGRLSFNFGTEVYELSALEQTHQDLILRRYQAQLPDGSHFHYQVENVFCVDIKSGEPFHHRVEIQFQGQAYRGCGQSF